MTPPITQIEMNLQNLMIQAVVTTITQNLTTITQENQVAQVAVTMTPPEKETTMERLFKP
jgi:hypothetical protein